MHLSISAAQRLHNEPGVHQCPPSSQIIESMIPWDLYSKVAFDENKHRPMILWMDSN